MERKEQKEKLRPQIHRERTLHFETYTPSPIAEQVCKNLTTGAGANTSDNCADLKHVATGVLIITKFTTT